MLSTEFQQSVWSVVLAIIAAFGGSGAIIFALSSWFGKLWADRLQQKTAAKYDRELEELKNSYVREIEFLRMEASERRDAMTSSLGALATGYTSSQQRVVDAMELLWSTVMEIRDVASPYLFHFQILLPQEYVGAPPDITKKTTPQTPRSEFDIIIRRLATKNLRAIEQMRPFVGEELWLTFWVYQSFAIRQALKVVDSIEAGTMRAWDQDVAGKPDPLLRSLPSVFTAEELDSLIKSNTMAVPQRLMNALELKILDEMNKWLFGRRLVDLSLSERERIIQATIRTPTPPPSQP